MSFFTELNQRIEALRGVIGDEVSPAGVAGVIAKLDDEALLGVITQASSLVKSAELLRIAASGVAADRSRRELGHSGLAQTRGHRNTVTLLQELSGSSRADAAKHIRLGSALIEASEADASAPFDPRVGSEPKLCVTQPWHAPLGRALMSGVLSSAQHDAIMRGLGEPPAASRLDARAGIDTSPGEANLNEADSREPGSSETSSSNENAREAWSLAAELLIDEARSRTVEELLRAARSIRDQLDPTGAEARYLERFEKRSFRQWIDEHGQHRASITFDDYAAMWLTSALGSAMRPRRGGPRFVDPAEKARAEELANDPRSNDQLAYDFVIDTLRAGMLADAEAVFGTRQAGVRLLISEPSHAVALAGGVAVGISEEDGSAVPAWLVAQHACESGIAKCHLDREGNPLFLGREQRLFSSAQRVALAIRDGGCLWPGCDRPPSYCEAHHIDPFASEGGKTDIDRGVLLCRFHHMQLHNGGWRISRQNLGTFLLHPPGEPEHAPHPRSLNDPAHAPHPRSLSGPANAPHPRSLSDPAHAPHPRSLSGPANAPHPRSLSEDAKGDRDEGRTPTNLTRDEGHRQLHPRLARRFLWGELDPPPRRFYQPESEHVVAYAATA